MTDGSFLMVRFSERQKMFEAVGKIQDEKRIKSWNAVDGHYGLVITTEDDSLADWAGGLEGFSEMASCKVKRVGAHRDKPDEMAYAYLFIESSADHQAELFTALEKMQETYFCAETSGDFSIVAVIGGDDFSAIDRIVENRVQTMPGVLRMKQDRLIYLDHI